MAWFITLGTFPYVYKRTKVKKATIILASYENLKVDKHYESIRSLRLNRLSLKLQVETPSTPYETTFNTNEFSSNVRLLPQTRRPNKLKQLSWHIEILEQYSEFTSQTLNTTNGSLQISLFDKDLHPYSQLENFVAITKFSKAAKSTVFLMLKIYDILDSSTFRNYDLEMTMINLIKSAREQSTNSDENQSDISVQLQLTTTPPEQHIKPMNDRQEEQIIIEFTEQIESEILLVITILSNDIDHIVDTTTYSERLNIAYRLILLRSNLTWMLVLQSRKRLTLKIKKLIDILIYRKKNYRLN